MKANGNEIKIAVVIPCRNEELTIGKVIDDFHTQLPSAAIYVVDNSSIDASASVALKHGAVILKEPRQGKGFVVENMFAAIDADVFVMVDGDDTYPADCVAELLEPVVGGDADMAVGARLSDYTGQSFPPLHVFGNHLVRALVNWMGKSRLTDIMSGYRVFNRRVTQTIPVVSSGFEVETEMTIQMLYYRLKIVEVPVTYKPRTPGSESKLNTFRDGFRVLWKIFTLFRAFKPLTFFCGVGLLFLILGVLAGILPILDYLTEPGHYVRHLPLAVLAAGLVILAAGCIFLGILLHALNWRFMELHNVLTRGGRRKL
jgi:glycosyltransferase involved in cell wall biosynthesis